VGDRRPMHATGTGLVLLANADNDVQEAVLRAPLTRYTRLTVVDPHELRRRLAQVRRTGVAIAHGQITLPDMVVAVPVLSPGGGEVIASISVVVRSGSARPRDLARALAEASRAISRALAWPYSPPGRLDQRPPTIPGHGQSLRQRVGSTPR